VISVNKINNLRKSDRPKIFRRAKNIFRKKTPCNRHQKISTAVFWRIRPKLAFQKSVKTPIKKKVFVGFFGNRLWMKKPKIKFKKVWSLGHGSCVWAQIAQTFPITSKRAFPRSQFGVQININETRWAFPPRAGAAKRKCVVMLHNVNVQCSVIAPWVS
jgi:hypothetical protein